jgi:RND family efflux transporter MFP subunit
LAGPDAAELEAAVNGVETAQIAVDQAKLALKQAQIVAPTDGVVTAVTAVVGESSSGAIITTSDLDNLEVVVQMSEVDVTQVQPGQKVEITLDALNDVTLEGEVSQIAPAGTLTSGVVNYPVTVSLTVSANGVKTGMTANLSIIIAQKDNVLTVPNRAVKTVNDQKVVTLLENGQQVQVPVEVGMSSDAKTEIVSGVEEGDLVVVSTTTSSASSGSAAGSGAMMGAGGPPPGM